jgi:hypothetical protein
VLQKLLYVAIPPTMVTMEWDQLWLWVWVLFGLWLLTRFLSLLPKKLITYVTFELDRFLEIICLGGGTLVDRGLYLVAF